MNKCGRILIHNNDSRSVKLPGVLTYRSESELPEENVTEGKTNQVGTDSGVGLYVCSLECLCVSVKQYPIKGIILSTYGYHQLLIYKQYKQQIFIGIRDEKAIENYIHAFVTKCFFNFENIVYTKVFNCIFA